MDIPTLVLHHYTSGCGLRGIFEDSEIWATSIHQLNDSREFAHAIDLGKCSVRAVASAHSEPKARELAGAVASHLDSISQLAIYVTCFSEVEDSLSQWRGYCPPGFGYSIGFDGARLRKVAQPQGFRLEKCIYDYQEQKRAAEAWSHRTLNRLLPSAANVNDIADYVRSNCPPFLEDFVAFAPFQKDASFKAEIEWRLVALVPSNDPRLRLRPARTMLVRYLPIKLHLNPNEPLVWNVQVGPTPHPKLAGDAVCHYFNKVHIQNGVGRSHIPYRDV